MHTVSVVHTVAVMHSVGVVHTFSVVHAHCAHSNKFVTMLTLITVGYISVNTRAINKNRVVSSQ